MDNSRGDTSGKFCDAICWWTSVAAAYVCSFLQASCISLFGSGIDYSRSPTTTLIRLLAWM